MIITPGTQGICPNGWHIPTLAELETLKNAVGGEGNAFKAIGQGTGNGAGTNTSGFSALLAGYCSPDSTCHGLGGFTYFWSSTESISSRAYFMYLLAVDSNINFSDFTKDYGFSVRCLRSEN